MLNGPRTQTRTIQNVNSFAFGSQGALRRLGALSWLWDDWHIGLAFLLVSFFRLYSFRVRLC